MPLRYALSPSGGLLYHIIAFRRAHRSWKPFRSRVRAWLNEWRGDVSTELIVFGPSAGWTLPLDILAKSRKLTIVEPDPIARAILRSRLKKNGADLSTVVWITDHQILPWFSTEESKFEKFLAERPNADILFANVLGQIPLHYSRKIDPSQALKAREKFLYALAGRRWASYHDAASGPSRGCANHAGTLKDGGTLDFAEIFSEGDVTDHETSWISERASGGETQFALWPLTESRTHVIALTRKF